MNRIDKYLKELTTLSDENKIKIKMNCACGIIIKKGPNGENLVLLLKRSPDDHWPHHYDCPRGKCDGGEGKKNPNEKIIPCLKREVKEETGLDIKPILFIDKFKYLADRGTRETTQYNFLCKIINPNQKIKLSKEHCEYKWISSVGEIELMLLPEMKKTISKILNPLEQIVNYPENEISDTDDKYGE